MGFNFDKAPPPAKVDSIREALVKNEEAEEREKQRSEVEKLSASIRSQQVKIQESFKNPEMTSQQMGWIEKYRYRNNIIDPVADQTVKRALDI